MGILFRQKFITALYFVLLIFLGIVVFYPSFLMGLYGDEWLILWFAKAASYNNFFSDSTIWSAYWIEMVVFNFISNLFGYEGFYYYLFSFLCRFGAAISLIWFLTRRDFSLLLSFIGSAIFLISPVGIEATDWVRNFDSYLGICVLLFCIDRILKLRTITDVLIAIIGVIALFLINPLRSHGNILVLLIISAIYFTTKTQIIKSVVLIISFILLYILFIKINIFGGHVSFVEVFRNADFVQIFKSFFANISKVIVPSPQYQILQFLLVVILLLAWKRDVLFQFNMKGKGVLFLLGISAACISLYITWSGSTPVALALLGFYFFCFLIVVGFIEMVLKNYKELIRTILVICLALSYMLFPAFRQPEFYASFDHRYLIYSALVIPLISVFSLDKIFKEPQKGRRVVVVSIVCFLVSYFSFLSWNYLFRQNISHNESYSRVVWLNIQNEIKNLDWQKNRIGFILVTDPVTGSKIGNSMQFGFGFHMGLIQQIWKEEQLPYLIIDDKAGIYSMLTDGKASKKYFGVEKITPKDSIVVLRINNTEVERIPLDEYLTNAELNNANH